MMALQILFWVSVLLVLHVYLGYPVYIYVRSKLHRAGALPPEAANGELPRVTVLIPAHNKERWIARKIENTLAMEYPSNRLQVLVASDGCTDNTVDIAGGIANVGSKSATVQNAAGSTATLNRVVPDSSWRDYSVNRLQCPAPCQRT